MINFSNMDAVWDVIGSKKGDEKPTEQELSQFAPDLAYTIKKAFETQDWKTKEYRYLFDTYWDLEYQRQIDYYVQKQSRFNRPQNVVIEDIYYSNYGEPHKKGDKISWISLFGQYNGIIHDFKMAYSTGSYKPIVILFVKENNSPEIVELRDAHCFSIQGKDHEKYFDEFLKNPVQEINP